MKKAYGFTAIELLVVIAIIAILSSAAFSMIANNRGWTEDRAYEGARGFVEKNGIDYKRITCAGDSDNDGYGTCNLVTNAGEKITLSCPTNWMDTTIWGASQCKEMFHNINMSIGQ